MSSNKKTSGAELARKRSLFDHERVIENARRSFIDMGRSLAKIRNDRLYGEEFDTFAEYCEARWEISETYANRMINAARVALKATPIGVEINSEAVARELVSLTEQPELLRQVWDEAERRAAGGRITAALVRDARDSLVPPADPELEPALEGEVIDPLALVPAAEVAVNKFLDNQTSGLGDASPATESGTKTDPETNASSDSGSSGSAAGAGASADRPAPAATQDHRDAIPGEAEDEGPEGGESSDVDGAGTPATQTGSEGHASQPSSDLVDGREQRGPTGVSSPAALDPEAFDKFLDEHVPNSDPHQKWRAAFLRAIRQSHALAAFPINDVATNGNTMCFDELVNLRDFIEDYLTKVQTKRVEIQKQQAENLPDNVTPIRRTA